MSIASVLMKVSKVPGISSALEFVISTFGKIHWRLKNEDRLRSDELGHLRKSLTNNYFIILTQRKNYLSCFMVSLGNWMLTGKWSFWSHVLMNLEDEVKKDSDFRLVEATSAGVSYSTFEHVFECNAVCLLKPKSLNLAEWTSLLDAAALRYLGTPYDNLFDLASSARMSCVELVREILKETPDYSINFADFERMIAERNNLTPEMFYECPDFEIVFEVRR